MPLPSGRIAKISSLALSLPNGLQLESKMIAPDCESWVGIVAGPTLVKQPGCGLVRHPRTDTPSLVKRVSWRRSPPSTSAEKIWQVKVGLVPRRAEPLAHDRLTVCGAHS